MSSRKSINVDGFNHAGQPIPAACRVGNIVATGGVYGLDSRTGKIPDAVAEQAAKQWRQLPVQDDVG